MTGSAAPKTLLEMAGAPNDPASLSQASLVLIDCQREYVDGALVLPGVDNALSDIAGLLSRARAAGTPIVHVVHKGKPGGAFDLDDVRGQIADAAAPAEGEQRIEKTLPNAFAGTDLADRLDAIGRKKLLVAGFMTHMCISSTVRAGLDFGFGSTVIASATGTRDLPKPGGGVIEADALHVASLAALADRFAIIADNVTSIPD